MAIYPAKNSLLKIEYPAGAGVYTTVALLTQLSIDQSAPTIQAGGLLFQDEPQHVASGFADLKTATISASGYASDGYTASILQRLAESRAQFSARFYIDATDYYQANCKMTAISFSGGHSDAVAFSVTLAAANVTDNL
jgi:predicted secreted protein